MTTHPHSTDWRTIERMLVDYFEREGPRPQHVTEVQGQHAGDWIIRHGNRPVIMLSDLARELAFKLGGEK